MNSEKMILQIKTMENKFFILFGMYFSTLAIAATLTVQFVGALI